ncbi:MAG: hypothetical protein EKK41_10820 [Hyphomicrobiales bacterium]|nr:MAG: hypothetical protein EKK41_10820 [Hyphomicrobiales bacterium]
MAMIIEFRGQVPRGDVRSDDNKAQGEIIIFPGVRRERHAEPAPAAASGDGDAEPPAKPRRRAKPKRDRIELPD